MTPILKVEALWAGYLATTVLRGVSLELPEGSVVAVLGPNGAGKTTLLRALSGMIRPTAGRVVLDGRDITGFKPHSVVKAGMAHVPEGRRMFPYLTTEANLRLGGYVRGSAAEVQADVDAFLESWPVIGRRRHSPAGQLSGGEQQLVALGRALMSRPRLMLLDEPSMGLAPVAVQQMYSALRMLAADGQSILLVEQNARHALELADHVFVLAGGAFVHGGPADGITAEEVAQLYFHHAGPEDRAA